MKVDPMVQAASHAIVCNLSNHLCKTQRVLPVLSRCVLSCRQQAPKKRHGPDDWDAEYDKGKVKKVKSKRGGPDAWQQSVDVFGKVGRSRGRGGFGGGSSDRGGRGGLRGQSGSRGRRGTDRGRSAGRGGHRGGGWNVGGQRGS